VRVSVGVRTFGPGGPSSIPVTLVRGGETLATAEAAIEGETGTALLELLAGAVSSAALDVDPTATVRIAPGPLDALTADDERGVLLRPPSAPRVVIVDRAASTAPARFLERALLFAPREEGGPIAVRRVEPVALGAIAPGSVDVLVVLDVDLRDARLAEAVRGIVEGGAGLLVAAGPHAGPGSDVRVHDLLPARIAAEAPGVAGFSRPLGSPLPPLDEALSRVRIDRRVALELEERAEVLLAFADGSPAWVWSPEVRTAVLATGLDDAWTDFPYRPAFLPTVVRGVTLLARPGAMPDEPAVAGALPALVVPPDVRAVSVVLPGGAVTELVPSGTPAAVPLDGLAGAGAYAVSFADAAGALRPAPRAAFVLAPDAAESDQRVQPLPEPRGEGASESGPSLVRTDVSAWAYLLAGLAALVEGALRLRRSDAVQAEAAPGEAG
jgi:hypothetical protein